MSLFMYHSQASAHMLTFFAFLFMIVLLVLYERSVASRISVRAPSDHFDGNRFFNPNMPPRPAREKEQQKSVWVWLFTRSRGAWKRKQVTPSVPPESVHDGIRITYINHATVLIQCAGINVITDPVWSYRASPFPFLGPVRYADPGVRMEDLPKIDIVLLSHNHYDHMDLVSLRAIARKWSPQIYTGLGNAAYLARKGVPDAHEMDWWDSAASGPFTITATPAQHFSARALSDRNATLWCGFMLETPLGAVYFAGDTGYGSFIDEIGKRFPKVHVALLPIGAYDPAWMMQPVHANPHEAIRMFDIVGAEHAIGIHFGTFRLTDEPQDEPPQLLERHRGERDFRALENGVTVLMKGTLS